MMKKFSIIFLSIFCVCNAYADKGYLGDFNEFLAKNIDRLAEYGIEGVESVNVCKVEKRHSKKWFDAECNDRPGGVFQARHKLKIKFYKDRDSIKFGQKPNFDTLFYYGWVVQYDNSGFKRIGSKGSSEPYKFTSNLREDSEVKKEMQETGLLSYLLYEDGKIVINEKTPKDRFGFIFNDKTLLTSASMGKSMTSYVIGHAICEGYIDSVDSRMNDWPLIEDSLFYDQKLMDLLNMAAGHQKYADQTDLKTKGKWSKNPNRNTVKFHMKQGIFKNTKGKQGKSKYHYSNAISNILINYAWYKSNGKFQNLLDKIFIDKAKVENPVHFLVMHSGSVQGKYIVSENDGPIRYSFKASRYDYLRIAKAMVDDWQNDTCVGKYLKTIYKNRIPKKEKYPNSDPEGNSKSYAGQFHTDYVGKENRAIMGMSGNGWQSIVIDFDQGKIIVVNTIYSNYDWEKLVISKFN